MRKRRWPFVLAGVVVLLVFVGIGAALVGVSWVREHVRIESAASGDATAAFDEVRRRFAAKLPMIEMEGDTVVARNVPADDAPRTSLQVLHVLAWDDREAKLARIDLPFWLLRLKESPIRFGTYASGLDELQVSLTPSDLERYGPGIVLDLRRREERALLWVE